MKIAVIMLTTITIDEKSPLFLRGHLAPNHKRWKQYANGLRKFSNFISKYNYPTFIIDNSTKFEDLEPELKSVIQQNNYKYLNNTKNNYGKINKGAGLIEAWRDNVELLAKYDYIIHYEPRMQMTEDCVISKFFEKPGNYFKKRIINGGVETGFFIIDKISILKAVLKGDNYISHLCKSQISLEHEFNNYINKNNIPVTFVPKLGVNWFTYTNTVRSI